MKSFVKVWMTILVVAMCFMFSAAGALAAEEMENVVETVIAETEEITADVLDFSECTTHTPEYFWPADYTECGGGIKVDYYECGECFEICDEDGNALDWDEVYAEGTGKHTPGEYCKAHYTECGGGTIVDHYECAVCRAPCDKDGNELDWDEIYAEGTGKHTPGEYCEADYTECGGGMIVDYYKCEECHFPCDKNGNELDLEENFMRGTGEHTPGELRKANYTECLGGFTEDYYECKICSELCDENGDEPYILAYEEGIGHNFVNGKCTRCGRSASDGGTGGDTGSTGSKAGDLNEDEKVDSKDLIMLMRLVVGDTSVNVEGETDLNNDSKTDILDVIRLVVLIAG